MIRRRIQGLEGPERLQALKAALADLPGYHQGPYGQLRRWVLDLIAAEQARGEVRHKDSYFLPRQGAAQIALVGPASSGKSSLLRALTGRRAAVGDYPCTTLRPQAGMVDCQGAQIQLIDLPGLLPGAAEGRGGGRAAMAAIRMADAALHLVALGPADLAESLSPHVMRHAFATLDAGVPLRDVQKAASPADPRTTMRYDRARGSLDRHATYIVAAYIAGARQVARMGRQLRLAAIAARRSWRALRV